MGTHVQHLMWREPECQTGQEIAHDFTYLLRAAGEEVVGGAQDVQGLGFRQASQEVVQGRQRRQLVGVTGDE